MKKSTFILAGLLSCLLTSYQLYAQAPDWSWAKSAGGGNWDYGRGIAVDAAGNSYVTGYFKGSATFDTTSLTSAGYYFDDIFVAKYDASSNLLWAKRAGGE